MNPMYDDLERPPLHADVLRRAVITSGSRWTRLDVEPSVGSTNAVLAGRAARGESGAVLIAEHQTAGRGRLDRVWTAPPRSGLTMSMLVRIADVEVGRWPWLPLLAGLAVAAAVRDVAGVDARLKWPNDVVVDDRKVAGLLVERVESAPLPPAAVIGVGLNVSVRSTELPTDQATSLALEGASSTDRSLLARTVLRMVDGLLSDWEAHRGDPEHGLRRAYESACSTIGRRVRVQLPDGTAVEGTAVAVEPSGRLVLETADGHRSFGAGDVVHLRPRT